MYIEKLVKVSSGLNNSKNRVDNVVFDKLKTAPNALKESIDAVDQDVSEKIEIYCR